MCNFPRREQEPGVPCSTSSVYPVMLLKTSGGPVKMRILDANRLVV